MRPIGSTVAILLLLSAPCAAAELLTVRPLQFGAAPAAIPAQADNFVPLTPAEHEELALLAHSLEKEATEHMVSARRLLLDSHCTTTSKILNGDSSAGVQISMALSTGTVEMNMPLADYTNQKLEGFSYAATQPTGDKFLIATSSLDEDAIQVISYHPDNTPPGCMAFIVRGSIRELSQVDVMTRPMGYYLKASDWGAVIAEGKRKEPAVITPKAVLPGE